MTQIPGNAQFRADITGVPIVEKGSSRTKSRAEFYTMDDIIESIPGGGLPDGLKLVTGIIYWDGTNWDVLNNADHSSVGISSVSTSNGAITVNYTDPFTKAVSGFVGSGGLTAYGIVGYDLSMGLASCEIAFSTAKVSKRYIKVDFNGTTWVAANYGAGSIDGTPSVTGIGDANSKLAVNFGASIENALTTSIKVGGPNYQSWRAYEWSSGFSNTNAIIKLKQFGTSLDYTPVIGDWFMIEIQDETETPTNNPNRLAVKNTLVNVWSWLPASFGGSFKNFQILTFGK